jgi:serine/threonine-protein kinase
MSDVYLARATGPAGFSRHVIIKEMRNDDEDARAMFLDEARLLARLHHQNIAQVYDLVATADDRLFLAMEYVHGHTVGAALRVAENEGFRLPLDFALTVVDATAMALHHAHERRDEEGRPLGIVHRDVNPANVMVSFDGAVKLIDFGIASAWERAGDTESGVMKGKIRYMAPEQADGDAVDRRTDVFGLGAVLYELTTQCRVFQQSGPLDIVEREVTPPSEVRRNYAPVLEDIVMTAMARDPGYRFPDAETMARAVRAAASQLGLALGPAAVSRTMKRLFHDRDEPWLHGLTSGVVVQAAGVDVSSPTEAPRRHPASWGVVAATGALAAWAPADDTDVSTARFLSLESEPPAPPETFAVGSWPLPRLAVEAEGEGGGAEVILLDVEAVEEEVPTASPATQTLLLPAPRVPQWLVAAIAALVSAAVVGAVMTLRAPDPTTRPPAPTPAMPPAPAAPAAAAAAPATPAPVAPPAAVEPARPAAIQLRIVPVPRDATIVVDGRRLGRGARTVERRRGAGPLRVKVRRRGYRTRVLELAPTADATVEVRLRER